MSNKKLITKKIEKIKKNNKKITKKYDNEFKQNTIIMLSDKKILKK